MAVKYDFSEKADTDFLEWLKTPESYKARKMFNIQVDQEADMTHAQRADLYNSYRGTTMYYEMVLNLIVEDDDNYCDHIYDSYCPNCGLDSPEEPND